MSTPDFENVNKIAKSSYESLKQLYALNTTFAEQIADQQMALLSLSVEYVTTEMKIASSAKGYKDMVSAQNEIAGEISNKIQGIARNTMDIINETKDDLTAWFEKNAKETEKGLKEVSKIAPLKVA